MLSFATIQTGLEGIMLGEIRQIEKDKYYVSHFYVKSEKKKKSLKQNRLVVTKGKGWG